MRFLPIFLLSTALATGAVAQQFKTDSFHVMSRSLIEQFGEALGAAPIAVARPLIRLAFDLIKDFEGWESGAYNDPVGYCTIGYGHLISLKRCEVIDLGEFVRSISHEKGETILEIDTRVARLAVQELVTVDLSDQQFGALASFVFNVGKRNFAKSTLLRLLNTGEYELASGQFARWVRAQNRVLPGLVARRACEESLFQARLEYDRNGDFNRAVCTSLGAAPNAGPLIDIDAGE